VGYIYGTRASKPGEEHHKASQTEKQTQMNSQDIFVRAHTVVEEDESKKKKKRPSQAKPTKWAPYMLLIDCETTTDVCLDLTFGFFRFCELQPDGNYACQREGIFYASGTDKQSLELLHKFSRENPADTMEGCPKRMDVLNSHEFVRTILKCAINLGASLCFFNAPFDLSRFTVQYHELHKNPRAGWGLTFKQYRNKRSRKLLPDSWLPRIIIEPKDSRSAFIRLSQGDLERVDRRGRFLDLSVLAYAQRGRHFTLKDACKEFRTNHKKLKYEPAGRITLEEIRYCRRDVACTLELLNAVKQEYESFPIDLRTERAMSAASLAKAYLSELGLQLPSEKFNLSSKVLGRCMQAYYGGRSETRIRHQELPVVYYDFTSEYPTVNAAMGLWKLLIANELEEVDCTTEAQDLLNTLTPEQLLDKATWRKLEFVALVKPDGNMILPVRTRYGDKIDTNIGSNYPVAAEPLWYAGPDLAASAILTKQSPNIIRAFKLIPKGVQEGLKETSLGNRKIDPRTEDFFKAIIEERKNLPDGHPGHFFLKILANAGGYGIWAELNKVRYGRNNAKRLHTYSGEFERIDSVTEIERPGPWYFPPVAALITAGGRLLLALLERMVSDAGGTYMATDTDAMSIVSTERGGLVPCAGGPYTLPDGQEAVKALSWKEAQNIADQFNRINPYSSVVKEILKLEDYNKDSSGKQVQLYGFAISAKRYCLYTRSRHGQPQIIKPSEHGLGHYFFPDRRKRYKPKNCKNKKDSYPLWIVESWKWLLEQHENRLLRAAGHQVDDFATLWFAGHLAVMRFRITTPNILKSLRKINPRMARPFNFGQMPILQGNHGHSLISEFNNNPDEWGKQKYIDTKTGKITKLGSRFTPKNMIRVLRDYYTNPEAKSLAPSMEPCKEYTSGLLRRGTIHVKHVRYIGKEVNRKATHGEDLSHFDEPREYRSQRRNKVNSESWEPIHTLKERIGIKKFARDTGIDRRTIRKFVRKEGLGEKAARRILDELENYKPNGKHR
jgi:DNA polymerase type B, organellar and viral